MDVSHILDPLNTAQREAVAAENGNLLVLAGAGSGKTRVLVHRIAWHIETGQTSPYNIMAVTFTNKAANEMRTRIGHLLGQSVRNMWVGTFHSLSHRLLRKHWQEADLPEAFQIIDSEDQYRIIRRVIRSMQLDESRYNPKEMQWFINARKDEGLRPAHIDDQGDAIGAQRIHIYKTYQAACEQSGLVDFAELLLRIFELFRDQTALREHYQHRFKHILVDEFQDTNTLQYNWLRSLLGGDNTVFAVGDDDQSVYSWRGARVENMRSFKRDFKEPRLLKLEQNYRSTATILKAANHLIENNRGRLGKDLWTEEKGGDPIVLYGAYNEIEEAGYVVDQIKAASEQGKLFGDCAILYRVSAQSRVLEGALMQARIPYRVYGGMRFYERAEVKDALAYVRLARFYDDASFERIVNTPVRGIGNRTLDTLRQTARHNQCSLWDAAQHAIRNQLIGAKSLNALEQFIKLIQQMRQTGSANGLNEHVKEVIHLSGLIEHFRKEKGEKGAMRIENLEELIAAAGEFEGDDGNDEEDEEIDALSAFLDRAALESGEGAGGGKHVDCVHMMTLHSAKGLEFSDVFMVGVEEGLFPHQRSIGDPFQLEEERRLCYVGITRAQKRLTLTHTHHRRLYGAEYYPTISRFIEEIPEELLAAVRLGKNTMVPISQGDEVTSGKNGELATGQRVSHAKFGEGVILNMEGSGRHTRIQVNFEQAGCKWLIAAYAGLSPA